MANLGAGCPRPCPVAPRGSEALHTHDSWKGKRDALWYLLTSGPPGLRASSDVTAPPTQAGPPGGRSEQLGLQPLQLASVESPCQGTVTHPGASLHPRHNQFCLMHCPFPDLTRFSGNVLTRASVSPLRTDSGAHISLGGAIVSLA